MPEFGGLAGIWRQQMASDVGFCVSGRCLGGGLWGRHMVGGVSVAGCCGVVFVKTTRRRSQSHQTWDATAGWNRWSGTLEGGSG